MNVFSNAWQLIKAHRRAFIIINLGYFGLVVIAMVVVALNRDFQQSLLSSVSEGFSEGPLATVAQAYLGGDILPAILLTFAVNFFIATLLQITLPSLVIPFSGFLMGILRAVMWGFLFSPNLEEASSAKFLTGILVTILLLLEGEGYVMGLFGAYLHGKATLWPGGVGARSTWAGYKVGVKQTLLIYIWVALILFIAAVYEVFIVVFLL